MPKRRQLSIDREDSQVATILIVVSLSDEVPRVKVSTDDLFSSGSLCQKVSGC